MTLPRGIRRTKWGYEARVKVNGQLNTKRFPPSATVEAMVAWQTQTRARLTNEVKAYGEVPGRQARGTFAADVAAFLPQIAGRSSFKADRSHLYAWLPYFGDDPRVLGTAWTGRVNTIIAEWQQQPGRHAVRRVRVIAHSRPGRGSDTKTITAYERNAPVTSGKVVAPRTIRHRLRLLAELYHTLDGAHAETPVDEAKVPAVPKSVPDHLPDDVLTQVLQELATLDRKTFARFAVHVTTGQRPCQIMRAQPPHVNLESGAWLVRSAKGEPAHTCALSTEACLAWRAFIAADAWGVFDTTHYGNVIHRAGLPHGIRPYIGRHSLAIGAVLRGVDLGDVQALLGHTSPETTRRFYAPFLMARQRQVAAKGLEGRFADAFKPRLVRRTETPGE